MFKLKQDQSYSNLTQIIKSLVRRDSLAIDISSSTLPMLAVRNSQADKAEVLPAGTFGVLAVLFILNQALAFGAGSDIRHFHWESSVIIIISPVHIEYSNPESVRNHHAKSYASLTHTNRVSLPSPNFSTLYAALCRAIRASNFFRLDSSTYYRGRTTRTFRCVSETIILG